MELKEANQILKTLLDIGEEFIKCGAEVWRAEESLYRMCRAYGFQKVNVWLITTNIQVTVETPEGEIITQVRYVPNGSYNFDRLDYLNNLSRAVCSKKPSIEELRKMFNEVLDRPQQKRWVRYLAGILSTVGFGVFFNCDLVDLIAVVFATILLIAVGDRLAEIEGNMLTYNAIISFIVELVILICVNMGLGHHSHYITIAIVMLLIGGLGITNGVRDLLNRDIISGSLNIVNAFLGATGIAVGIAMAMLIMRGVM